MSLEYKSFPRATEPDRRTLAISLAAAITGKGGIHIKWDGSAVKIGISDWDGVNLTTVQSVVTNADERTAKTEAKGRYAELSRLEIDMFDYYRIWLNELSTAASLPTRSKAAVRNGINALIDSR